MNKDIAIGILAYNVSSYIEQITKDMSTLGIDLLIINDSSTDDTHVKLAKIAKEV
jgi:glycosyltransferase involved in cell wall biosynthesis